MKVIIWSQKGCNDCARVSDFFSMIRPRFLYCFDATEIEKKCDTDAMAALHMQDEALPVVAINHKYLHIRDVLAVVDEWEKAGKPEEWATPWADAS